MLTTSHDSQIKSMITKTLSVLEGVQLQLYGRRIWSLRLYIGFMRLKNMPVKDSFPLPRIDESLEALGVSKWLSTLDMVSGDWQTEVDESDKQKTVFSLHRLLLKFNVMSFGLCKGTFERLMHTIWDGLGWDICLIYIDDIIVCSTPLEQYLERIDAVFNRLYNARLLWEAVNAMCSNKRVLYMGLVMTENGVDTDQQKVNRIWLWTTHIMWVTYAISWIYALTTRDSWKG